MKPVYERFIENPDFTKSEFVELIKCAEDPEAVRRLKEEAVRIREKRIQAENQGRPGSSVREAGHRRLRRARAVLDPARHRCLRRAAQASSFTLREGRTRTEFRSREQSSRMRRERLAARTVPRILQARSRLAGEALKIRLRASIQIRE